MLCPSLLPSMFVLLLSLKCCVRAVGLASAGAFPCNLPSCSAAHHACCCLLCLQKWRHLLVSLRQHLRAPVRRRLPRRLQQRRRKCWLQSPLSRKCRYHWCAPPLRHSGVPVSASSPPRPSPPPPSANLGVCYWASCPSRKRDWGRWLFRCSIVCGRMPGFCAAAAAAAAAAAGAQVVVNVQALQRAHPSLTALDVAWGTMLKPQCLQLVEGLDRAFRLLVSDVW
jgi:hypothetical protein